MGKIRAVCISPQKGTQKQNVHSAEFITDYGIKEDAHAGKWHRQVSLLAYDKIKAFNERGAAVEDGAFGENLIVEGIDFQKLEIGTRFQCSDVILELTQKGKECHTGCEIFHRMGDCIMPREGVFARVIAPGTIREGDELTILSVPEKTLPAEEKEKRPIRVAVITSSDSGFRGEREDLSGPAIIEIVEAGGFQVVHTTILPDEIIMLCDEMKHICDHNLADLILTTGGTGFSPRDCMPEATMKVTERMVPGIPEAMRAYSMQFTGRAMLSRAACGIRKSTLILNLPGSPKAVRECLTYVLPQLEHGIRIMTEAENNCAR